MHAAKEGPAVWDRVIDAVLQSTGLVLPVSAFALALACGLELCPHLEAAIGLRGFEIHYDARASDEWQDAFVLREVARWALRWCHVQDSNEAVRYVARAFTRCICRLAG